jgi:hypothetical protein
MDAVRGWLDTNGKRLHIRVGLCVSAWWGSFFPALLHRRALLCHLWSYLLCLLNSTYHRHVFSYLRAYFLTRKMFEDTRTLPRRQVRGYHHSHAHTVPSLSSRTDWMHPDLRRVQPRSFQYIANPSLSRLNSLYSHFSLPQLHGYFHMAEYVQKRIDGWTRRQVRAWRPSHTYLRSHLPSRRDWIHTDLRLAELRSLWYITSKSPRRLNSHYVYPALPHLLSVHSNLHYHVSCCCIGLLACAQQNGICTPSCDR